MTNKRQIKKFFLILIFIAISLPFISILSGSIFISSNEQNLNLKTSDDSYFYSVGPQGALETPTSLWVDDYNDEPGWGSQWPVYYDGWADSIDGKKRSYYFIGWGTQNGMEVKDELYFDAGVDKYGYLPTSSINIVLYINAYINNWDMGYCIVSVKNFDTGNWEVLDSDITTHDHTLRWYVFDSSQFQYPDDPDAYINDDGYVAVQLHLYNSGWWQVWPWVFWPPGIGVDIDLATVKVTYEDNLPIRIHDPKEKEYYEWYLPEGMLIDFDTTINYNFESFYYIVDPSIGGLPVELSFDHIIPTPPPGDHEIQLIGEDDLGNILYSQMVSFTVIEGRLEKILFNSANILFPSVGEIRLGYTLETTDSFDGYAPKLHFNVELVECLVAESVDLNVIIDGVIVHQFGWNITPANIGQQYVQVIDVNELSLIMGHSIAIKIIDPLDLHPKFELVSLKVLDIEMTEYIREGADSPYTPGMYSPNIMKVKGEGEDYYGFVGVNNYYPHFEDDVYYRTESSDPKFRTSVIVGINDHYNKVSGTGSHFQNYEETKQYIQNFRLKWRILKADGTFLNPNEIDFPGDVEDVLKTSYNAPIVDSNTIDELNRFYDMILSLILNLLSSFDFIKYVDVKDIVKYLWGFYDSDPQISEVVLKRGTIDEYAYVEFHDGYIYWGEDNPLPFPLVVGVEPIAKLTDLSIFAKWEPTLGVFNEGNYQVQFSWETDVYTYYHKHLSGGDFDAYRRDYHTRYYSYTMTGDMFTNFEYDDLA